MTSTSVTYNLRTDRDVLPEPPLPLMGPAGSTIIDPTFGTSITRITDESLLESIDIGRRSWTTGSSAEQNTYAKDGSAFILQNIDGGVWVPFGWVNGKRAKLPTPDGAWYLPLNGPAFSYNEAAILFGRSRDDKSLCKYNLYTQELTTLADFPSNPVGEVSPSADDRLATYGNGGQDTSTHVYVWDGTKLRTLDTVTGKVDDIALPSTGLTWGFGVHNVRLDKSGKYAVITTSTALGPNAGSPLVVWDIDGFTIRALEPTLSGHKVGGYGELINQDVAAGTQWDDMQYVIRNLDGSDLPRNLISPLLSQRLTDPTHGQDSHLSWNNHTGVNDPVLVSAYREAKVVEPWRPWVNELLLIATNGSGTVYRVCHHRSVYSEFYDGPHAVISPDGKRALFTSNWGRSLGISRTGGFRQDVFEVELNRLADPVPTPTPTPTPNPDPNPSPTPTPVPSPTPAPPERRRVAWPKQQAKQNVILAGQWADRFKLNKSEGTWAEFEKVP